MSTSGPTIRLLPMSDSDMHRVAEMNRRLQEDEGANVLPVSRIEDRLRKWIESGWYGVSLIKYGDKVVGYLLYTLEPLESSAIYIRQLFIERDHRRKGFASAAIREFAQQIGPGVPIEIDVLAVNSAGRAFWEAIGFLACHTRMRLDRVNSRDG